MKSEEEIRKLLITKRKRYVRADKQEREAIKQFVNSIWIDVLEWVLKDEKEKK